jgi:nucleoid DNA-binding protein
VKDKQNKITRVKDIVSEIAHDLKLDKKLVKKVLLLTFQEISLTLLLKSRPIMIRRFIKFVIAMKNIKTKTNGFKSTKERVTL